jgi:hypothetical protein
MGVSRGIHWNWLFYDTGSVVKAHDPKFVWGTSAPDTSKNYAVPSSVTVAGLSSTMGWNDALGLTSTTGANGESSGAVYGVSNFFGRPSSKTLPTGLIASYQYTQNTVLETVNSTPVTQFTKTTLDGFGDDSSLCAGRDEVLDGLQLRCLGADGVCGGSRLSQPGENGAIFAGVPERN